MSAPKLTAAPAVNKLDNKLDNKYGPAKEPTNPATATDTVVCANLKSVPSMDGKEKDPERSIPPYMPWSHLKEKEPAAPTSKDPRDVVMQYLAPLFDLKTSDVRPGIQTGLEGLENDLPPGMLGKPLDVASVAAVAAQPKPTVVIQAPGNPQNTAKIDMQKEEAKFLEGLLSTFDPLKPKKEVKYDFGRIYKESEFTDEERQDREGHCGWFKVTNPEGIHRGVMYRTGFVSTLRDGEVFESNPRKSKCGGRLYFTELRYIPEFYYFGPWLHVIEIPSTAQMVKDPDGDKWGADRLLCGRRYSLFEPRTYQLFGLKMKYNSYLVHWALKMGNIEFLEAWLLDTLKKPKSARCLGKQSKEKLALTDLPVSSLKWCIQNDKDYFKFECSSFWEADNVEQLDCLLHFKFGGDPQNMLLFLTKNDPRLVSSIDGFLVQRNRKTTLKWVLEKKLFHFSNQGSSWMSEQIVESDSPLYYLDVFWRADIKPRFPTMDPKLPQEKRLAIRQWFHEKGGYAKELEAERAAFELKQSKQQKPIKEKEPLDWFDVATLGLMAVGCLIAIFTGKPKPPTR
jgi:hypothetical protein